MMNIRVPAVLMFTKAPDVWSRNAVRTHRRWQSCACRIRSLPPLRTCGRHGARERHPELQTSRSNIPRPRDTPSNGNMSGSVDNRGTYSCAVKIISSPCRACLSQSASPGNERPLQATSSPFRIWSPSEKISCCLVTLVICRLSDSVL